MCKWKAHPRAIRGWLLVPHPGIHGRARIDVQFIDDYFRFPVGYFVRRKSDNVIAFKRYNAWAENAIGTPLDRIYECYVTATGVNISPAILTGIWAIRCLSSILVNTRFTILLGSREWQNE